MARSITPQGNTGDRLAAMALLLVILLLGSSPEAELRCAEIAFSEAAERRDLEAFASWLHPNAVFIGGGGPLRGASAVLEAWGTAFFGEDSPAIRWRPDTVVVDDELGLSTGPYRILYPDGRQSWGRFSSVWQREGDVWRVRFDNGFPGSGDMPKNHLDTLTTGFDCAQG